MQMTGSIRRMERRTGRALASRESPLDAFPPGAALPGPVLTSGPGAFRVVHPEKSQCVLSRLVPVISSFHSYFIPPERKSIRGGARRSFHEQGHAV
jgi:hypothetical protein